MRLLKKLGLNHHKFMKVLFLRLWSINPVYLDQKGLGAVWREGLLAKKVLMGKTKGWKNHPQLIRFKNHSTPLTAIGFYLFIIHKEGCKRGYSYDKSKISKIVNNVNKINISIGQLTYEFEILKNRVKERNHTKFLELLEFEKKESYPKPHQSFQVIAGKVELWEKSYWKKLLNFIKP